LALQFPSIYKKTRLMVIMTSAFNPFARGPFPPSNSNNSNGNNNAGGTANLSPSTDDVIPQWPNFVSPTSSGASQMPALADPQKRCRSSDEEQRQQQFHQQQQQQQALPQQQPQAPPEVIPTTQPYEPSGKRRRDARYVAPRQVPKTFTSTMGSLAAAGPPGGGNLRVHLRQQLSGSNLMAYLGAAGGGDAMDVEDEAARPRSMSL
jgi:hypothetical protein